MFDTAVKVLRGLVLNPVLVAFARGAAEAAAMAACLFGLDYVSDAKFRDAYPLLGPALMFAFRQLEGVIDKIDPAKQRRRDVLREAPHTDDDGNP